MTSASGGRFDAIFDAAVAAALELEDVPSPEFDMLEGGLDSLGLVALMMRLEDELGAYWDADELSNRGRLATVGALRAAARERLWRGSEADA